MAWYGKEHLNPTRTKALVKKWQSPPGNTAAYYYMLFPNIYPNHLPDDHYIKKYNEEHYPKDRDYRTFKSAPKPIKSNHIIEWEDGYGPCNVCEECISTKKKNDEITADYYNRLKEWKEKGTPM
jgi:hypothetical protein